MPTTREGHPAAEATLRATGDRGPAEGGTAAWIELPGHRDAPAVLEVVEFSVAARTARTVGLFAAWGTLTATTFFVTIFDPFMTSMPLVIGAVAVYRSWRGRYRVRRFQGSCPRCGTALQLEEGAKVGVPHPLVCYDCHHEPRLMIGHAVAA